MEGLHLCAAVRCFRQSGSKQCQGHQFEGCCFYGAGPLFLLKRWLQVGSARTGTAPASCPASGAISGWPCTAIPTAPTAVTGSWTSVRHSDQCTREQCARFSKDDTPFFQAIKATMEPSQVDRHYANIQGSSVCVICSMYLLHEHSREMLKNTSLAFSIQKAVYAFSLLTEELRRSSARFLHV